MLPIVAGAVGLLAVPAFSPCTKPDKATAKSGFGYVVGRQAIFSLQTVQKNRR